MDLVSHVYLLIYFSILGFLSIYGFHRFYMTFLYLRYRNVTPEPKSKFHNLPWVTVQLPIYNEPFVVERLIRAVCEIDYPCFEIQVLDDSDDETSTIATRLVTEYQSKGVKIEHIQRNVRTGFKAGALAEGLKRAKGEFLLIFDADFLPEKRIVHEMIHFFTDPLVGMVQARWGYLNRHRSILTHLEAILLNGHFVVEHSARNYSGRWFNFNGTAGIWRKTAITSAGGWHFDTLTEDLDLSYRAQMQGWRFIYLNETTVPSELPITIGDFFSQQHRWSKGAIQTAKKLLPTLLKSDLSFAIKTEAFFHLTSHVSYILVLILGTMMFPAILMRYEMGDRAVGLIDGFILCATTLSIGFFYMTAEQRVQKNAWKTLLSLPLLMAIGIGMSVNNTRAVIEGFFGEMGTFVRTPKYGMDRRHRLRACDKPFNRLKSMRIETGLLVYFALAVIYLAYRGFLISLPFMFLFFGGFLLILLHHDPEREKQCQN